MNINKKLLGAYSYVFDTPEGETVLKDLMEVCGWEAFTDTSDPVSMAYKNGKRDTYLYLITMMKETKEK
jgi:hypothetical protein